MYEPFRLSAKDNSKLKTALADLEAIEEDLARAKNAGVPNIEHLEEICRNNKECISKLRSEFGKEFK